MTGFPSGQRSFLVREICEPEENSLRVVIVETTTLPNPEPVSDLPLLARPVVILDETPSLELLWPDYVAYAVENESYAALSASASPVTPSLPMLRRCTESAYLDYLARATFASEAYPGPLTHWIVITLRHVVNVVSVEAPRLRWLTEPRAYPIC